jgi:hypothetical protein
MFYFIFLLILQLLVSITPGNSISTQHSGGAIFWDPEYEIVTTTYCNESDTAQHWILNDTKIWSAQVYNDNYGARSRCMSLAPNALNLQIASEPTEPCRNAFIGRVGHLAAYDSDYFDKQCLERLQTFDYWEGEQFHDFANVVTRNCDGVFYNNKGNDRPWLKYQTAFSGEFWQLLSMFFFYLFGGHFMLYVIPCLLESCINHSTVYYSILYTWYSIIHTLTSLF